MQNISSWNIVKDIIHILSTLRFTKSLRRKTVSSLAKAIVAAGIRIAHLVDVAYLKREEASELQHQLQSQSHCTPLAQFIHHQLKPALSGPDSLLTIDPIPSFMISLTGWLLEYPVIYVQSVPDEDDASLEWRPASGNALSGVPLTVVAVGIGFGQERHDHRMLSFSYPSLLFNEQQHQVIHNNLSTMIQSRCEASSSDIYFEIIITQETLDRVAM
ncbi:hypothetical protein INT44_000074 [Umbelopsis vinacea]|uniref:Uncharacterized protein n=1 Tax=Umbelopsis vinacea TaxID=44442 RepID=A0A8H7U7F0_9FUNG|nr:hypothetical protein INT44_000074 [Umbelopsis vinacea]